MELSWRKKVSHIFVNHELIYILSNIVKTFGLIFLFLVSNKTNNVQNISIVKTVHSYYNNISLVKQGVFSARLILLGCGSCKEPLQPGGFLLSHTLWAEGSKSSSREGGHRTGQSLISIFFTIFLIVFHIFFLVKYFLFLISLFYLFILAHPFGEVTPLSLN